MPGRHKADERIDFQVAERAAASLGRYRSKRPLTAEFMQQASLKGFGHKVGRKRAARMVTHLRATNRITPVGRYRGKRHGFWVTIYRLAAQGTFSVRKKAKVKTRPWWKHGLFGNPGGQKPEGVNKETRKRWRGEEWRLAEIIRGDR